MSSFIKPKNMLESVNEEGLEHNSDLTMVANGLILAALKAEEQEGACGDVQQEREADPEGGQEHGADGAATPGNKHPYTYIYIYI